MEYLVETKEERVRKFSRSAQNGVQDGIQAYQDYITLKRTKKYKIRLQERKKECEREREREITMIYGKEIKTTVPQLLEH